MKLKEVIVPKNIKKAEKTLSKLVNSILIIVPEHKILNGIHIELTQATYYEKDHKRLSVRELSGTGVNHLHLSSDSPTMLLKLYLKNRNDHYAHYRPARIYKTIS